MTITDVTHAQLSTITNVTFLIVDKVSVKFFLTQMYNERSSKEKKRGNIIFQ